MTQRIIFATGNPNKMKEIREILADTPYEVVSMKEAGIVSEPEENGATYEENALIKVRAIAEQVGDAIVMADDSGFEVDYLDKQPGVYSARFMGYDTSYDIKNQAILDKLKGVPDEKRTARFCCAVAVRFPDGTEEVVKATFEGRVAYEAKGTNGFGYDPIFLVPEYGRTDAELPPEVKNSIGHRGKALRAAADILRKHEKLS